MLSLLVYAIWIHVSGLNLIRNFRAMMLEYHDLSDFIALRLGSTGKYRLSPTSKSALFDADDFYLPKGSYLFALFSFYTFLFAIAIAD